MKTQVLFLFVFFLLCLPLKPHADEIVLVADEWCPYNCEADSDMPGFVIEIAQSVFARHGHSVKYVTSNWARAIVETRMGKYSGIIGAFKEDAPDFVFPENEQAHGDNHFYIRWNDSWRYKGLKSLNNLRVGIIIGYSYGEELDQYLMANLKKNVEAVPGNNALVLNIRKLMAARIDVFIEDQNVFIMTAREMGVLDKIVSAGSDGSGGNNIYVAFSPAIPASPAYAKLLSDGMVTLRKTGELKTILAKYGLADWR